MTRAEANPDNSRFSTKQLISADSRRFQFSRLPSTPAAVAGAAAAKYVINVYEQPHSTRALSLLFRINQPPLTDRDD